MSALIVEARSWLGTPYVHQQACKGAGCDCLGLIMQLWAFETGQSFQDVPAYTPHWGEIAGQEHLLNAARVHLFEVPQEAPLETGQVLLFRMRQGAVAKHLGLVSRLRPHPYFIHAYSGRGVVESALSAPWSRRIAARFTFT